MTQKISNTRSTTKIYRHDIYIDGYIRTGLKGNVAELFQKVNVGHVIYDIEEDLKNDIFVQTFCRLKK